MSAPAPADEVLILNPNALITPVADYPLDIRDRLGGRPDDFVVSERRSRYSAVRVNSETAGFIRRFETPRRLLEAVLDHSEECAEDPVALLDLVFPLVCQLQAQRILLRADDARSVPTEPRFAPGQLVAGCEVLHCVEAQTETEVYRVRTPDGAPAALKWVPEEAPDFVRTALVHEARMLRALEALGSLVPRVIGAQLEPDAEQWLLLSWSEGRNLYQLSRAADLGPLERAEIGTRIARAYSELHRHGVLHGDVHPGNVLADRDVGPTVLDFGISRWITGADDRPRAGLLTDYEPEAARALLAGRPLPPATPLGEQYCVAAVIFRLVAGTPCLRLPLESRAALHQIVHQQPKAFADVGLVWPALEAVRRRALHKEPSQRFATMAALHDALAVVVGEGPPRHTGRAEPPPGLHLTERVGLQRLLRAYGPDSDLLDAGLSPGPTASVYYGAAGIAYALLRAAVLEADAAALDAADGWIERAVAAIPTAAAFEGPEIGIRAEDIGRAALFHRAAGVHMLRAMIRHVSGDAPGTADAIQAFLAALPDETAADRGREEDRFAADIMNGAPGHLLGACLLLPASAGASPLHTRLTAAGRILSEAIAESSALRPPGHPGAAHPYLGFAHGVAGPLFSLCRWADLQKQALPEVVSGALDWLAAQAVPAPEGCAWPIDTRPEPSAPWTGWCHGSAGHVLLWSLAARVRNVDGDRERAVGAARHLWAHRAHSNPSVCCGLAGEALSLLVVARLSGDSVWIDRARVLLEQADASPYAFAAPHSLFRGRVGVDLAWVELEHADEAGFPLCHPL